MNTRPRNVICHRCGCDWTTTAHNWKYCPDCKPIVDQELKQKYKRLARGIPRPAPVKLNIIPIGDYQVVSDPDGAWGLRSMLTEGEINLLMSRLWDDNGHLCCYLEEGIQLQHLKSGEVYTVQDGRLVI